MCACVCLCAQPREQEDAIAKHAVSLAKLGRMNEAVLAYDRAVDLAVGTKSQASLLGQRAMALQQLHRSVEAVASAQAALVLDPQHPQARQIAAGCVQTEKPRFPTFSRTRQIAAGCGQP